MDHFTIVPPNGLATAQFVGLPVLCCIFAAFAHWKLPRTPQVLVVKLVCVIAALLQLRVFYYAKNSAVEFVDDRMQFKVPSYYDRSVSLRDVDFAELRIVNLNQDTELQPDHRTDGIVLLGYHLGWHRLANGENAWVAISDRTRVVVIPVYDGPTVLVSVDDPQAFTERILSGIDTSFSPEDANGS